MEKSEPILFFAARRGLDQNKSYIVIVGFSPHENKSFRVKEKKLKEKGIQLGSFLLATVVSTDKVEKFQLTNYDLDVKVEGNAAYITIQSAEVVTYNNGKLGFKTKPFGIVNSVDKKVLPGCYKIRITANKSAGEQKCFLRQLCSSIRSGSETSSTKTSPLCGEVISSVKTDLSSESNAYENYPTPLPRSSGTNQTVASRPSETTYEGISSRASTASNDTLKDHSSSQEPISHDPTDAWDTKSLGFFIKQLPNLEPVPLPRTIQPSPTTSTVPSRKTNTIVGEGFSVKDPGNPKIKIDKKNRLPANCIGQKVAVRRQRNECGDYDWVVC